MINSANYSAIQYNVLAGDANGAIVNIAPSAQSGIPLISNGSSAQSSFNTMKVAGGGTGVISFAAYTVICGGATSSGALQTVSGSGAVSQVLASNGSGALPSWQTAPTSSFNFQVVVKTFTSGTALYTPTSGMTYSILECVGGGGGGGGARSTTTSSVSIGGGGGAGGYARKIVSAATIGTAQLITVGSGGSAGTTSGSNGGTGGTSSIGSIVSATGGNGGLGQPNASQSQFSLGGTGGSGVSGNINAVGGPGLAGVGIYNPANYQYAVGGNGGYSHFGGGSLGIVLISTGTTVGFAGSNYGGGGSSGACFSVISFAAGGAGASGIVVITEYVTK